MLTATGKIIAIVFVILLAVLIIGAATGCTKLIELDRLIWSPLPPLPGDPDPDPTPPLVEIVASTLALFGFTGMAFWIRKVRKRSCTKAEVETIVKNNNNNP